MVARDSAKCEPTLPMSIDDAVRSVANKEANVVLVKRELVVSAECRIFQVFLFCEIIGTIVPGIATSPSMQDTPEVIAA